MLINHRFNQHEYLQKLNREVMLSLEAFLRASDTSTMRNLPITWTSILAKMYVLNEFRMSTVSTSECFLFFK